MGAVPINTLDNRTIAKIALATAEAVKLRNDGEVIGPTYHKVLAYLKEIDDTEAVQTHQANQKH